jgi:hypothetical protein
MGRTGQTKIPFPADTPEADAHVGPFQSSTFRDVFEVQSPFLRLADGDPKSTDTNEDHMFQWSNSQISQISCLYLAASGHDDVATLASLILATDDYTYHVGGKMLHNAAFGNALKMAPKLWKVIDRILAAHGLDLHGLARHHTQVRTAP